MFQPRDAKGRFLSKELDSPEFANAVRFVSGPVIRPDTRWEWVFPLAAVLIVVAYLLGRYV